MEQPYTLSDEMSLAPDGMYHGLTANGSEIVVSPRAVLENLEENLEHEEWPGQASFFAHDPGCWSGALESGVYDPSDVYWAREGEPTNEQR